MSKVTGRVSSTRIGRSSVFSNPITKAAIIAEPKLLTTTPEYRCATSSSAAARSSQRTMIFMGDRIASHRWAWHEASLAPETERDRNPFQWEEI